MQVTVISVPLLAQSFGAVTLSPVQWLIVVLLSLSPLLLSELEKFLERDRENAAREIKGTSGVL